MRSRTLWLLLLLSIQLACRRDLCVSEPPSFELQVSVQDLALARRAALLELTVQAGELAWHNTVPTRDLLADQRTALAIVITPPPREPFPLKIDAAALDVGMVVLASGKIETTASPDGCNTVGMTLLAR
jgi:hypothetical protein